MVRGIKSLARKFLAYLAASLGRHLAYRGELAFWVLAQSLPLVFLALWVEGGPRPDLDYARYYFFAWLAGFFHPLWVAYELAYEINTGRLSPLLLRPFSPALDYLASQLGLLLVSLVLGLPVAMLFPVLFPGFFSGLELLRLPGYLLYLALGFAFHFALAWLIGSLAFFLERSTGVLEAYYGLLYFFGGVALPLDVLPPGLLRVLEWTPLPYLAFRPAAWAAGWEAGTGYGVLALWTLWVGLLAAFVWRRGLVRYGAFGA